MKKAETSDKIHETAKLLGIATDELRDGLNLKQAGRVLGIAASTVRRRALNGDIGYQRDGRAWRFCWWHLLNYVRSREQSADTPGKTGHRAAPKKKSQAVTRRAKEFGLI